MRPYRKEKLGSLIREVIGEILVRGLNDPRVSPLTTVTRVELTSDLTQARVFVRVHEDAATERRTMRAIRHATGYMQRTLAGQLTMRTCPQLRFELDEAAKTAQKTLELIDQNRQQLAEDPPPTQSESESESESEPEC